MSVFLFTIKAHIELTTGGYCVTKNAILIKYKTMSQTSLLQPTGFLHNPIFTQRSIANFRTNILDHSISPQESTVSFSYEAIVTKLYDRA